MVENPPANAGDAADVGSIPGSGRSLGVGNDIPLQYSCLENSINREAWWATVHEVAELYMAEHAHSNLNTALTALQADLISSPTLLSTQSNYV